MSSGTSTDTVPLKPDTTGETNSSARLQAGQALQPWQFFVLTALLCSTAVTFLARGQGLTAVLLLAILMGTTALVGMAALRALRPLVSAEEDRTSMIGHRTRAALEREKMLALRAIKELEFDRAMGKLSDDDWREMSGRLRARAARLMRQLDAGAGYRDRIERDLARRMGDKAGPQAAPGPQDPTHVRAADLAGSPEVDPKAGAVRRGGPAEQPPPARACASCSTANDADARFCKECGQRL